MNPLTLVKRIQKLNSTEANLGISESASWHAKYKDSAYVFVGGIPYDLTEGDLLAVFAQYGEIVDVNLVRDKSTGKSKGFAFIAYEDQRSTNLAVDNFNGAQVLGRTIRVDHVNHYKKKEEEDEEAERQKREERGVCRQFQKGECTRGDGCKFSHDEQRAANTGWGQEEDRRSKWAHDNFEGERRTGKHSSDFPSRSNPKHGPPRRKFEDHELQKKDGTDNYHNLGDADFKLPGDRARSRQELRDRKVDRVHRDRDRSKRHEDESYSREDYLGTKEDKRARRHTAESDTRENRDDSRVRERERDRRSSRARDSSSTRHRDDEDYHRSRR